jgi:alanyl-tRNA synthetase
VLDVSPQEVPETAERFFEEWKQRGKRIEQLQQELAEARAASDDDAGREVDLDDATAVVRRIDADMDELRATANALVEEGKVAVLGSGRDGGSASSAERSSADRSSGQGPRDDDASGGSPDVRRESGGAQFVVAVPDDVALDAGTVVGELASRVGGGGGGPPDFAQGGGPDGDALDDALEDAPDVLRNVVNA